MVEETPLPLRWVEDLVNTRSIELDTDDVATPAALAGWLRARGLLGDRAPVSAAGHRRALRLREGLRALIGADDPEALADLAGLAHQLPLVLDVNQQPPRLVAGAKLRDPVDTALAAVLGAVADAVADGSWTRLKTCRNPGCRWAYFDHSRNRSRAWCSMESCGNRAKARTFRQAGAARRAQKPGRA